MTLYIRYHAEILISVPSILVNIDQLCILIQNIQT